MSKITTWALGVVLLLALAAPSLASAKSGDNIATMTIKVGETITVEAPDQGGSTGYAMVLKSLPECLALSSMETIEMPIKPKPGRMVVKRFTFVGIKAGRGTVEINQSRLWEKPLKWARSANKKSDAMFFQEVEVTE